MAWVRIDDQFADHPKVAQAGPLAMALHVAALCYCNRHLTDGFIPRAVVKRLLDFEGIAWHSSHPDAVMGSGMDVEWGHVVGDLVDADMWAEVDGGYRIHDYLEYQPSRAEQEQRREQRREAGRKGGKARAKRIAKQDASEPSSKRSSKTEANSNPGPVPGPVPDEVQTPLAPDKPARKSDPIFEALCEVAGWDWRKLNDNERGKANKATKMVRQSEGTAADVRQRAKRWPQVFPGATLTPLGIVSNWQQLGASNGSKAVRHPRCPECDVELPPGKNHPKDVCEAFQ